MNEDQWLGLMKDNSWTSQDVGKVAEKVQAAAYKAGFEAAKAEYVPVLMAHLRILADLRAQIEVLPSAPVHVRELPDALVRRADVLAMFDGGVNPPDPIFGHDHGQ